MVSMRTSEQDKSTYWIIQILDLLHQLDHVVTPAVSNERLLRNAQSMLRAYTAALLLYPLVYVRLKLLLDFLIVPPDGNVEV